MTDIGNQITGALRANGFTVKEAMDLIGVKPTAWNRRMHDPSMFRAGEIKMLRRLIPDKICDEITR